MLVVDAEIEPFIRRQIAVNAVPNFDGQRVEPNQVGEIDFEPQRHGVLVSFDDRVPGFAAQILDCRVRAFTRFQGLEIDVGRGSRLPLGKHRMFSDNLGAEEKSSVTKLVTQIINELPAEFFFLINQLT